MSDEQTRALLADTSAAWGWPLSSHQLDQFALYLAELQLWNRRVNLTAITDPLGITIRHFLDSLRCALSWGERPQSLIDIGSGAGFPGIPLKLLVPELRLTLIEATGKKVAFLTHISAMLGLTEVTLLNTRAEAVGRDPQHRERYDVATARAVAAMHVLVEYALPLVRVGGRVLLPKGAAIDAEVQEATYALARLGGNVLTIEPVLLPDREPGTLVVLTKCAPTPEAYPRPVGIPMRHPLGKKD